MQTDSIVVPQLSMTSGAAARRRRVAKGLPRYTSAEMAARAARNHSTRSKAKVAALRTLTDRLKTESGCIDCGYNAHPAALDFDHLPGTPKRANISQLSKAKLSALYAEIAKCEIVCSNCHRIRTYERRRQQATGEAES